LTIGAAIGSVRTHGVATGATAGDILVLAFRLDDATLEAVRFGADDTAAVRLHKLLGHTVRTPSATLAAALTCRPEDVGAVLDARGDGALADLLDAM